jgi:hypothetical protein
MLTSIPVGKCLTTDTSQSYFTTGSLPAISPFVVKPLETHDQHFFQVNHCGHSLYVTSSRQRGWFSSAQSFLGPSPEGLMTKFTVSDSRLHQCGGPGPRVYIPQEQGDPVTLAGTGFPSVASYDSQVYGGGIRTLLHTGIEPQLTKLYEYNCPSYNSSARTT